MFDLEKPIADWRRQMQSSGIRRPEVLDELEAHLREHVARLQPDSCYAAAFQDAVQQLGDGKALKKEFAKMDGDFLDNCEATRSG